MSPASERLCGCGCGRPADRPGQSYRADCHAAYMRAWRAREKRELAELYERERQLDRQLAVLRGRLEIVEAAAAARLRA